jgi:hypothetical protein
VAIRQGLVGPNGLGKPYHMPILGSYDRPERESG